MVGEIDPDDILDYVAIQFLPTQNRFEAFVCSQRKKEKVASGLIDQIESHLPLLKEFNSEINDSFKLQLPENLKGSLWFCKSTLLMFFHIVNMPELFKKTNSIQNELNQLEETRRFHLTLYAKDNRAHVGGSLAESLSLQGKLEAVSSDITKNELLKALDLRVAALNEELTAIFKQALGDNCSKAQIIKVAAFVQHFGTSELRDAILKYTALHSKTEVSASFDKKLVSVSHDWRSYNGEKTEERCELSSQTNTKSCIKDGVSPAKIAQAERQISEESEQSSDSSEEVESSVERSRPVIRSASPRRSASPMRRIQIGRSGSRRATALTIKSLSCIPAREKTLFNRDDEENTTDDELTNQQPKRSENAVLRMSVQDRINLFESKQRDQDSNAQKKNATTEASLGAKKSVLRRWSAGMGDSSVLNPNEKTLDAKVELISHEVTNQNKSSTEDRFVAPDASCQEVDNASGISSSEVENRSPSQAVNPSSVVNLPSEVTQNRAAASAEWTKQKEAELNQMLMKMMATKPAKYASAASGKTQKQELSCRQNGDFCGQYKVKREEKLQSENAAKRSEKEVKSKIMRDKIGRRKEDLPSKLSNVGGKLDGATDSQRTQRARRNSSPPVLPKASVVNPAGPRKASPRAMPTVNTGRNSWPSVPSPRTAETPHAKDSSVPSPRTAETPHAKDSSVMSCNTVPNRRKTQPTSFTTQPASSSEKPRQAKGTKASLTGKSNLKCRDDKKEKVVIKGSSKNVKTSSMTPLCDDSGATPTKPSFYDKVTKKGSVVPLESKPFLRKGTGNGSGVGPALSKARATHTDKPSKQSVTIIQTDKESSVTVEAMTEPVEEALSQINNVDQKLGEPISCNEKLEEPNNSDLSFEKTDVSEQFVADVACCLTQSPEFYVSGTNADDESGISASAWVEVDHDEDPVSFQTDVLQASTLADAGQPVTGSSPRVRHSLSQMLQAEIAEPEIVEWGNAEIPPALVSQKDAPRGLKRLLKFTRKGKGESNMTGFSSPVFSEGEEDTEEPKVFNKKNTDAPVKKAGFKVKGVGMQRNMLCESYDGGKSSMSSMDQLGGHDFLSVSMNGFPSGTHKLREGLGSSTTSTKGARSFFSLSTFRSNKSSEAKLR